MTSAQPRVVLDANVLFSRVLHNLLGRAASAFGSVGLFDVCWSDELLDETAGALVERYAVSRTSAAQAMQFVRDGFPENRVDISGIGTPMDLSRYTRDPQDEHVCALAIAAKADVVVTGDRGFRRTALQQDHGVDVLDPDAFLFELLVDNEAFFVLLLEHWASSRQATTPHDLLEKIAKAGCERFASRAADLLADGD